MKKAKIIHFNPDCEMSIAQGDRNYCLPRNINAMANDLSHLPFYYSENGDYILAKSPNYEFIEQENNIFNRHIKLVDYKDISKIKNAIFTPWGLSPRCLNITDNLDESIEKVVWKDKYRDLYLRTNAQKCLEHISTRIAFDKRIIPKVYKECLGLKGDYMLKDPLSSSGRGVRHIWEWTKSDIQWINGVLKRRGFIMVEPYLNKIKDFAMEFFSDGTKVHFTGFSYFKTEGSGDYKGNYLLPQHQIYEILTNHLDNQIIDSLITLLEEVLHERFPTYKGYIGVDMMIYLDEDNNSHIHPCVEINLRYTMGMLAVKLQENFMAKETKGIFKIQYFKTNQSLQKFCMEMKHLYPLHISKHKISSGFKPLIPINIETKFLPFLLVGYPENKFL